MGRRETSLSIGFALCLLSLLAGCGKSQPLTYRSSFVAQNSDASAVLMLVDHTGGNPYIRTVDIETGARGERNEIGSLGACGPAVPGRIWCGYQYGEIAGESGDQGVSHHESRRVSTFELIADDSDFVEKGHGLVSLDDLEFQRPEPTIDRATGALVFGGPEKYFAVHPGTFEVSRFDIEGVRDAIHANEIVAAYSSYATFGDNDYEVDDDHHLVQTPEGSEIHTPLAPETTYLDGRIVLTSAYDFASTALVAHNPTSLFILSFPDGQSNDDAPQVLSRVGIDDGKILWQRPLPTGSVHATAAHGDVLGIVIRTTPWTATEDYNTVIDAEVLGVSMATGDEVWRFEI